MKKKTPCRVCFRPCVFNKFSLAFGKNEVLRYLFSICAADSDTHGFTHTLTLKDHYITVLYTGRVKDPRRCQAGLLFRPTVLRSKLPHCAAHGARFPLIRQRPSRRRAPPPWPSALAVPCTLELLVSCPARAPTRTRSNAPPCARPAHRIDTVLYTQHTFIPVRYWEITPYLFSFSPATMKKILCFDDDRPKNWRVPGLRC